MDAENKKRLRGELLRIAEEAREFGYYPARFIADLDQSEPDELIIRYVRGPLTEGFTRLYTEGRLDLAVETIAVRNASLFPPEVVAAAASRLEQAKFSVRMEPSSIDSARGGHNVSSKGPTGSPQVFATRVWGFAPELWPVITFGKEGDRDALIRDSRTGDLLVFVGTETEETEPDDRGRLLGLAEIGRTFAVETLEAVDEQILAPAHYNSNGDFKWPKGLAMLRAWEFPDRPRVREVLQEQLGYSATVRAVLLDATDTAAVLALRRSERSVRDCPAISRLRHLAEVLPGRATTGPKPTSWSGVTGRNADETSFTYAFQFGKRELWKIGHAKDLKARLLEVQRHVPHELIGETWGSGLQQQWPTEQKAYAMEQHVLKLLRQADSIGERVRCTRKQLLAAWQAAILDRRE